MGNHQCLRCERSFARRDHLRRHDRSREFTIGHSAIPTAHLTRIRYQRETLQVLAVPRSIYSQACAPLVFIW